MFPCLGIVCSCFHDMRQDLEGNIESKWPAKPNAFLSGSFQIKFADLWYTGGGRYFSSSDYLRGDLVGVPWDIPSCQCQRMWSKLRVVGMSGQFNKVLTESSAAATTFLCTCVTWGFGQAYRICLNLFEYISRAWRQLFLLLSFFPYKYNFSSPQIYSFCTNTQKKCKHWEFSIIFCFLTLLKHSK